MLVRQYVMVLHEMGLDEMSFEEGLAERTSQDSCGRYLGRRGRGLRMGQQVQPLYR